MHAIRGAWSVARRPAFWLPVLLALGVDGYFYGMHFERLSIRSDGWGY